MTPCHLNTQLNFKHKIKKSILMWGVNENSRGFRFLEFLIANQFRDKSFSGGKLILTDTIFRDVISIFKTSISKDASDQQIKELKIEKIIS